MALRKIASNSSALVLLDVISKVIPLVTFPIVVRVLGPEMYGKVGFAVAISGFFGLLAAPGFTNFGARETAANPNRLPSLIRELMGARIAFSLVSYTLLVAYTFLLAPPDPISRTLILITGLQFVVLAFDLQWVLLGSARSWPIALIGSGGQVVYAALLLAIVREPQRVWGFPVALVLSAVLTATLITNYVRRSIPVGWPIFQPRKWMAFVPTCLLLGVASMMSMIYDQIDTVMLKYMRPGNELGLYVASYRVVAIGMSFVAILAQVFFPFISSVAGKDRAQERQYMEWMGAAVIVLALPITVGGFMIAKPLTDLLLGSKFAGADSLLRLLIFNVIAASTATLYGARLIPNRRESRYFIAVATGAVVNVVLNLVYLPRYGAAAAACTTIASQLAVAAIQYVFTRDLPQPRLLPILGPGILATAAMGAALGTVMHFGVRSALALVPIGAVVYGLLMLAWYLRVNGLRTPKPQPEEELVQLP